MRKLLTGLSGFTLVELMVVVVVLGVLAGIAVQRMGDVRDRAEEAALEANIRLLLGAANLAKTRNYGDYMYYSTGNYARNGTIRWLRPCEGPAVTQFISQGGGITDYSYATGYTTITDFAWAGHAHWTQGQEWSLTDYLESFPIGYAVEIIFAARDDDDPSRIIEGGNYGPEIEGYHESWGANPSPYDQDQIIIYQFVGDTVENHTWNPLEPGGTGWHNSHRGYNYPYFYLSSNDINTSTANIDRNDWKRVFPSMNN